MKKLFVFVMIGVASFSGYSRENKEISAETRLQIIELLDGDLGTVSEFSINKLGDAFGKIEEIENNDECATQGNRTIICKNMRPGG